jgi:hypothetical protein
MTVPGRSDAVPSLRWAAGLAGGLAFALVATLNAGGYRYGAGDQAGYIPAILRHLDDRLFPRDRVLIEAQSRLFFFDELLARAIGASPFTIETWFFALYLLSLGLLYVALLRVGARLLASGWAVAAFVALETLRHRIAKTSANTLEGYFHPRQLAFAIGTLGLAEALRQRPWRALAAAAVAAGVHPMTGLWFLAWIGVAVFVEHPERRWALGAAGAAGAVLGVGLLASGFVSVARMDDAWVAAIAGKDYLFATDWGAAPWLLNAAYPIVIGVTFAVRRSRGLVRPGEAGLVAGCLALVAIFLATLPLVAAHVALAVQLQISRVFWMADLLAMLYLAWWLADRPAAAASDARRARAWPAVAFAIVAVLAVSRGVYIMRVEHPERSPIALAVPRDAWADVSGYLRRETPPETHVLADPDHAWRYGTSLRVAAARDVFLENVKDEAMSIYDRAMAHRLAERRAVLGDFRARTPAELRELARRYALDVVVAERDLALPELYRNDRFRVYRLTP